MPCQFPSSLAISALIAAAGILVLGGCQTLPPEVMVSSAKAEAAADVKPVGKNQVGEPCEYQLGNLDYADVAASRTYTVRCGSWQQPSGRVFEATERRTGAAQLAAVANVGLWRAYLNQRLACDEPTQTAILDNVTAVLLQCTRRNGGWPHVAIATTVDDRTFLIDGVPSALPALEATVAVLTNRPIADSGEQKSGARDILASKFAQQPFGSGDLDRYFGLMRLGDEQNGIDNFAAAEDAFRDALAVQQRILGQSNAGSATPLMHLALQISNQRRFVEADALFERAAGLAAQSEDRLITARLLYYRGLHLGNQRKREEATQLTAMAERQYASLVPASLREAARRTGIAARLRPGAAAANALIVEPDVQAAILGLAEVWRYQSALAYQDRQFDDSRVLAQRSRGLLEASGQTAPAAVPRGIRLAALSARGKGETASVSQELDESIRLFDQVVPNERPVAVTMFLSGAESAREGDIESALKRFRDGAKIVRDRRLGLTDALVGPYLDTLFLAAQKTPAEAQRLHAEMFEAAQLIQSGLTAQYIAKAAARLASGDQKVSAALRQLQEADLKLKNLFLDRDNEARKPPGFLDEREIARLDAEIAATEASRGEAESSAQAAAPAYGQLVQSGASAADVISLLGPGEGLLAIQLGGQSSFGFLVANGRITAYRIDLTLIDASAAVAHLRETAQVIVLSNGDQKIPIFDVPNAHQLYRKLFTPVEPALAGLKSLVISPNGALLSLPFEMLVTEDTPAVRNGDYRNVPFLLKRFATSYVPAPQTFVGLRKIKTASQAPKPFIGFGDFRPASIAQLAASFPPTRCKEDFDSMSRLDTLPSTRDEIVSIGGMLGAASSDIILGAGFTKDVITTRDLKQYRVVHLATHGFLPTELRCKTEPSILLSIAPSAANAQDAFLDYDQILKLEMDADLVVLSACNTAGPGGSAGESLSGLARAFFFAGTRGLFVTHWSVEDQSAAVVTTKTMRTMKAGEGQVATPFALRTAKLDLLASGPPGAGNAAVIFSHPFAWAPFVLIGDGLRVPGAGA